MALSRLTKVDSGGISTTSDYRVGVITATKFVGPVEGSITATDASFSGNVTIGGTLTYEDVTNIDSVGIITAQSDVHVGAGLSVVGVTTTTDLTVEKSGNLNANIKSTGGWGALEVGGATAGYIDIKKPFSDDFDLRLMVDGSGTNYISSNAANLKLDAQGNNGIELGAYGAPSLKYSNDTKLVTTGVGVSIPKDLDVDGHTNLDNVSIAGVTTMTGNLSMGETLTVSGNNPNLTFTDTNSNPDFKIYGSNGTFSILDSTNGVNRFVINSIGNISISNDLDVDGHTNLDNVSISGISSTGNIYITTGGDGRKLSFAGDGSSHYIKMDHTLNGPIINGYGGIAFETNGTNERLRIDTAGNVGMGTNVVSDSTGNARAFTIARSDANGQVRLILKNQATGFGNGAGYHQGIDGANVFIENRTNGGYIDFATFLEDNQRKSTAIPYQKLITTNVVIYQNFRLQLKLQLYPDYTFSKALEH